ncbi:MAG TPA: HAD family hydrolase [Myxococcales bacterium]|nr:HAD family hydrolase [Myxococcales bacterium]HIN86952.1 HAD family hydrolase [Myxococcales bacterium]
MPLLCAKALAYKALIFDMDGVLVDAGMSYIAAAVDCVAGYTPRVLSGLTPSVDLNWVHALKQAGGFNNDWELSSALVRGLAARGEHFDIDQYAAELTALGGGTHAVNLLFGELNSDQERIMGPTQELKRFFQELYLGETLFRADYGADRKHYTGPGYIDREETILSTAFLSARNEKLGIATGRPRMEARYALERFGTDSLFQALVTHDCACEAGQPGKPNPWILLEAAKQLNEAPESCVYVGDQPDDMRAANAAGMAAIGFTSAHSAEILNQAGAHWIVDNEEELDRALTQASA